ncbi:unnamed protein product [Kuraishia capsulata CBS 1993]|uniref:Glycoside hydrolase family 5 domain-containing protein n=1 Tax=Kuraishia capsulata CBS 1993 TaxID=1382522 RepID=W6MQ24_9ASCO|nr:uncharacterized protein KUCA_T00004761001 [Kuraishia capsulata CBS 1993]CDK28776.1 unnamed protein product [Kuraishia capsulata CBS 1993]
MSTGSGFLQVKGTKIVDENGKQIVLKGAAVGGGLNMENFITGFPGQEDEHKQILLKVLGKEKFDFFFDKFYEYFWADDDAKFFKSLNFNCLRIPVNYRHFYPDNDLENFNPDGFKWLDRYVDICSKHGIYSVIDLHAAPGGQNQDWHSDNGTHHALLWSFPYFQDKTIELWEKIAAHYKDNTWVAGYNPLNEPADSKGYRLINFYRKVVDAVEKIDPNHIFFLDGNKYAMDFTEFPDEPIKKSVYAIHDYSYYGFPGFDVFTGSEEQKGKLERQYNRKIEYMKKIQAPVWNGEFGPVYSSEVRGDTDIVATNLARYASLKEQLSIYSRGDPSGDGTGIGWSIWVYKDIGYQGLTFVKPESKYYSHLKDWLAKKQRLGIDKWGRIAPKEVESIYDAVKDHFHKEIPEKFHKAVYPNNLAIDGYIDRVLRECLLSQFLTFEFAEYFRDLSFEELDELASSFKFENLQTRDELNAILSASV